MRLINKVIALLFVLSLLGGLVACGGGSSDDNDANTGNGVPTDNQLTDANRLELVRMVLSPATGQTPLKSDITIQIRGGTAPFTYKVDYEGDGAFDKIIENVNDSSIQLNNTFYNYSGSAQQNINVLVWVVDSKNRVIVYDLETDPNRAKPVVNGIVSRVIGVTQTSSIVFDPQFTGSFGIGFTNPSEGAGAATKINFETGTKVIFRASATGGKAPYTYKWSVSGDTSIIQYIDKPGVDINQKPIPSVFSWEYFVSASAPITGTDFAWQVTATDVNNQSQIYQGIVKIFPKGFTPSDDTGKTLIPPPLSNVIRFRKTADMPYPSTTAPQEKDSNGDGKNDSFVTTRKDVLLVTSNPPYILADADQNIPREQGLNKIKYIELVTDGTDPTKAALQVSCAVADGIENLEKINYFFPLDTTGKPMTEGYDPEDKSIRCVVERNTDGSLKPVDGSKYPLYKRVRSSGTSPYLFQWDFTDDGVTDSQALAPTLPYLIGGSPYNPYLKPGTYYLRIKISDSYGRYMNDRTADPKTGELIPDSNGNLSTELIKVVVKDGSTQPGVNMIEIAGDYQPFVVIDDTTKPIPSLTYKIKIKGGIPPYYVAWDIDGDLAYDDGLHTILDPNDPNYAEADLVIKSEDGSTGSVLSATFYNVSPGVRIPRVIVGDSRFQEGTFVEIAKNRFNKNDDPILGAIDERGKILFMDTIDQKIFAELSFPTVIANVKAPTLQGKGTTPAYNSKARRGMGVAPFVYNTGGQNFQTAAVMAGGMVGNLSQRDVDAFNFVGKDGRYNGWSLTPMPTDRGYMAMAPFPPQLLTNKYLNLSANPPVYYAIGGYNNSFGALKTIEAYTITDAVSTSVTFMQGNWKTRIPMNNPLFAHAAVSSITHTGAFGIMTFGGLTGGTITDPMPQVTSQVVAYVPNNTDPDGDRFITAPPPASMKTPRYNISAVSHEILDIVNNGGAQLTVTADSLYGVYTFGGQDASTSTVATAEFFDARSNAWRTIPDLPNARAGSVALAFQTHYPLFQAHIDPNRPGPETCQRRITAIAVMGGFVKSLDAKLVPTDAIDIIVLSDVLYVMPDPTAPVLQSVLSPSVLNKIAPFTVDKYIPYKWISWTDTSKDALTTARYHSAGMTSIYGAFDDVTTDGTRQELQIFGGMGITGEINTVERRRVAP